MSATEPQRISEWDHLAVGTPRETEGQFFYSHHRWRGILKPSSVPLCVIQDMCLADIYKGRGHSANFATTTNDQVTANVTHFGDMPGSRCC
jgi:hypothetical protein